MSIIGNTSGGDSYPRVSFKSVGDSVAGRIVSFEDYQVKDFQTKEPKFFPSGDPIMGVKVHLELTPGDAASRVTLWAEKKNMLKAIKNAVVGAGAQDIEEGADLAVTFSGYDGRAHAYQAAYALPETSEAPF